MNGKIATPHSFSDLETKLYELIATAGLALEYNSSNTAHKWKASGELMKFFRDHAEVILAALAASSSLVGRPSGHAKKDLVIALTQLRSEWV